MTVYLVHDSTTGTAVSIGTYVADPLPVGLAAVALTPVEAQGIRGGTMRWDAPTRAVVAAPVDVRVANETTLTGKARAAITANDAFLAIASPTNAQTLAQVRTLTRETTAVIRLLLGADLLDSTSGT